MGDKFENRSNFLIEMWTVFCFKVASPLGIGHETSRRKLLDKVSRPLFDPLRTTRRCRALLTQ
ncbi:MAG: hypothetical protein RI935_701 [Candidatus Parcubacteria bacterium]|jgi:hypothetical protein